MLKALIPLLVFCVSSGASLAAQAPLQVYGVWHCGNDLCGWNRVPDIAEFDRDNHWLIDRGDGLPSVNLVVLSFVNPLKLLNLANDAQTSAGIPIGMTKEIVGYFSRKNIRVMLSIGGFTYTRDWDEALAKNPVQLGIHAAQAAQRLGVGIEIDYENDRSPNLAGLQSFIAAYRSLVPFDPAGTNLAARLTIDLADDDDYLTALTQYATANWLRTSRPVLDYANAMVPFGRPDASAVEAGWEEHIGGKPPVLPLAPAKLAGSLYISNRRNFTPECTDFAASLENLTREFVQKIRPRGAGNTAGMLGFMFWAAGCAASHRTCTVPPNTCAGLGMGARAYNISVPMLPLRQN
jgi:hypothetical protein